MYLFYLSVFPEQNETPTTQREMFSNHLHHLDTIKSMGPDRIHPSVLREVRQKYSPSQSPSLISSLGGPS